ncbi:MAG: caspase family protein [Planctomycetes bacterium]|nr:caspase family protein [Planctomycetota bacterium]
MRRALCVGIDLYPSGSLHGCVSDADRMANVLARHADDSPNFDCRKMVAPNPGNSDVVTTATLRQAVEELFKHDAEVALFHFSGHGTFNNLDGYLVTQDAKRWNEGVPMSQVLNAANMSPATEVVILLDCCFSGNFGNLPAIDNKKVMLREGVSILTASRGDQPSVEAGGGGVFTSLVVDALSGGAADLMGEVSAPAV